MTCSQFQPRDIDVYLKAGVVDGLTLATPNGRHEMTITIQAMREGNMADVIQVRGEAGKITVTTAAGTTQSILL